ncbi:LANO_0D05798g1_1 [Lachancea nothofagi CBS 11611]|uniref:F-actin-capping protein subunit alpha n=1 Tax=Lachancea nothofagi CBS 11611 TaxID=1266666 RepID=A0A1G4JGZ1_9SACH|nr:LANO_0D05798g1_1 [Lachancea nothofagi CBS 11611]
MPSKLEDIIHSIIASAPSGEIQDVYKDLKILAGDEAEEAISDAIAQYNVSNLIPISLSGKSIIISEFNKEGSKFFDPVSSVQFSVDHLNRKALDVEKCDKQLGNNERKLYDDLESYASKHFCGDVSYAVYPRNEDTHEVVVVIVSTKYSPGNFWNGHWKSIYRYNMQTEHLVGTIDINVHYFEDGNVSFKCCKEVEDGKAPNAILAIKKLENDLENEISASFTNLNERQFKLLRRRLPVTRSKINWGKGIGTYRLGKNSAESQFN